MILFLVRRPNESKGSHWQSPPCQGSSWVTANPPKPSNTQPLKVKSFTGIARVAATPSAAFSTSLSWDSSSLDQAASAAASAASGPSLLGEVHYCCVSKLCLC